MTGDDPVYCFPGAASIEEGLVGLDPDRIRVSGGTVAIHTTRPPGRLDLRLLRVSSHVLPHGTWRVAIPRPTLLWTTIHGVPVAMGIAFSDNPSLASLTPLVRVLSRVSPELDREVREFLRRRRRLRRPRLVNRGRAALGLGPAYTPDGLPVEPPF